MARHHRMPPEEAGYTYAVEPAAIDRLLANEEESIYGPSQGPGKGQSSASFGRFFGRDVSLFAGAHEILHACSA
jgi:hypothetical protein